MTRDFDGLVAAVTGGASGIGAAVVAELTARGARVAVLDLQDPGDGSPHALAVRADVSDDTSVRAAIERVRLRARPPRRAGQQRRHRRAGHGRGQRRRGVAARLRRQRDRHGPDEPRRAAGPAALAGGRRSSTPARSPPPPACRSGRSTARPRAPCWRSRRRWPPTTSREGIRVNCVNPGTADTPWIGRLLDRADDPAAERAALEARQPHGRLVSPRRSPAPSPTWPARAPARRRARRSPSTAACRTSASGPAASRARRA